MVHDRQAGGRAAEAGLPDAGFGRLESGFFRAAHVRILHLGPWPTAEGFATKTPPGKGFCVSRSESPDPVRKPLFRPAGDLPGKSLDSKGSPATFTPRPTGRGRRTGYHNILR